MIKKEIKWYTCITLLFLSKLVYKLPVPAQFHKELIMATGDYKIADIQNQEYQTYQSDVFGANAPINAALQTDYDLNAGLVNDDDVAVADDNTFKGDTDMGVSELGETGESSEAFYRGG